MTTRRQCRYRKCRRFLRSRSAGSRQRPGGSRQRPGGSTGPLAEFCNRLCRRRERFLRDDEQGRVVRTGYPSERPGRRKRTPGEVFGELTFLAYDGRTAHGDSYGLWLCGCGREKRLAVRNVTSGATTNCADRSKHPRGVNP